MLYSSATLKIEISYSDGERRKALAGEHHIFLLLALRSYLCNDILYLGDLIIVVRRAHSS